MRVATHQCWRFSADSAVTKRGAFGTTSYDSDV